MSHWRIPSIDDIEKPVRYSLTKWNEGDDVYYDIEPTENGQYTLFVHTKQALADRADFLRKKRNLSEKYGNLIRKYNKIAHIAESDIW